MRLSEWKRRVKYLFRRGEFAGDLQEEMRLHVEMRARQLRKRGAEEREASYMAQRQFGNSTVILDASSALWGWTAWERLFQDLRMGVRALRKTPGFTAMAVLTLALGLGINTAIFSVVNGIMIRSLPYPQAGRLVSLWEETADRRPAEYKSSGAVVGVAGDRRRSSVSPANLADYRRRGRAFASLAAYSFTPKNLTGIGPPERIGGESVTADFFTVLGVEPVMGRGFLSEDDRPGSDAVVIVTQDFWQRRLTGDAGALSRTILLDGRPYQVIGVLPGSFQSPLQLTLPDRIEFYVPAAFSPQVLASRGDHDVNVVGRLAPGASIRAAEADLDAESASLARQYPSTNLDVRVRLTPLAEDLVQGVRQALVVLLGASGLIVLIACVNVANLLLVRAVGRRHETTVRLALGAGRFRIVRQFLTESLLLAGAGCGSGVLLGAVLMRALVALAPPQIPRIHAVTMDWRVFAMAAAIAVLTGIAFGMAPAWQASQVRPAESLKTASRSSGVRSQVRWRTVLTVAEMGLSLVLLIGAGLLLKSFVLLMGVDLGFQPDRVVAMNVNLPALRYAGPAERLRFFERLEERVRSLPGVVSAAYANRMPLRGGWGGNVYGDVLADDQDIDLQAVSPGYFQTMGIPLVRGRVFTQADRSGQPYVAVVNLAFGRQLLNNADPLGHHLRRGPDRPWITIVGVVNDIRRSGKTDQIKPQAYFPAGQTELYPVSLADFAVRTAGDPHHLVNAIQAQVWSLDRDQPVTNVRTLEEIIDAKVAERRFQTLLLLIFAAVAVGLAVVGIFGVLSYSVSQRTQELGIRIALGARPGSILTLVLRQAGALIGAGVVLGLAGAYGLTQYIQSLLFGVQRDDWKTYAAAVALLAGVAAAAALFPARRGSRVDPIVALRDE